MRRFDAGPSADRRMVRLAVPARISASSRRDLRLRAEIRQRGTTIYFMPYYVITPEEINLLARIATEGTAQSPDGLRRSCNGYCSAAIT